MRALSTLVGGLECRVRHDDDDDYIYMCIALIFLGSRVELGEWAWFIQKRKRSTI